MDKINSYIQGILGQKDRNYTDLQNPNIGLYKAWYDGFVSDFHKYQVYNGTNYVDCERKSMGMAKQVAEDWASLLLNDKTDIILPNESKTKLDELLLSDRVNFWDKANEGVELAYALGIGAIVDRVEGMKVNEYGSILKKGVFNCSFVNAENIYPITIDNGIITECAFVEEGSSKIHIQIHLLENGQYNIYEHTVAKVQDVWQVNDEFTQFNTGSPMPWYHFIKPKIVNNKRLGAVTGISVFANAIDNLKAIDDKYDSFDNEFNLGRKRVYVSAEATKINIGVDTNGNSQYVPTFDPSDTVFYQLPEAEDGKPYVNVDTSELRTEQHIRAINQELNWFSSKCGLGEGYYKFEGQGRPLQTATAAILQNGNLHRKIKRNEIGIASFLRSFTETLMYICNTFTEVSFPEISSGEIQIVFDDHIVDDMDKQRETDRADYTAGLMTLQEYRQKWYDQDEKSADDFAHEHMVDSLINKYLPALTAGAIMPRDYVALIWGGQEGDELFDKRVEYITSSLKVDEPILPEEDI